MKNAMSSQVIGLKGCAVGRLPIAHLLESSADRDSILGVKEMGANFGLGGGGCNAAERFAKDMNGTVGFGVRGVTCDGGKIGEKK